MSRRPLALAGALLLLAPLAACTDNSDGASDAGGGSGKLTVESTADACRLSATEAPSGKITFAVSNKGDDVTEFYLLKEDGLTIKGEVENVGPGLTRNLVVTAGPGTYQTACKPGMVGDGIRGDFTVTDSGTELVAPEIKELAATASDQYAAYVRDQTEQLVADTDEFAQLYTDGKDDEARALYAPARMHWERIEPVAESFGDLDPRLDLREADLEEGQEWTGWHAIEKDLWPEGDPDYTPRTDAERKDLAEQLVADTAELNDRIPDLTYQPDQLANGAKELLDEVATGKVTGEEEAWSHTDLWDFQANVDGAKVAFENLRPILEVKDQELEAQLDEQFAAVQALLDAQKDGEGFTRYDQLSDDEVKDMADAVNALSEPLSKLTDAVTS